MPAAWKWYACLEGERDECAYESSTRDEAIARGLTKAQREALAWLPVDGSWSVTRAYWRVAPTVCWLERQAAPLAEATTIGANGHANDLRHRLTPLGLAVRDYLRSADHGN